MSEDSNHPYVIGADYDISTHNAITCGKIIAVYANEVVVKADMFTDVHWGNDYTNETVIINRRAIVYARRLR